MTWQSIWSELASWTYSGITLDIKVYNAIQRNTMQYNAIQCNTMQYHAIPDRPDKTRKEEWMVQPVFCIVDTGPCCWSDFSARIPKIPRLLVQSVQARNIPGRRRHCQRQRSQRGGGGRGRSSSSHRPPSCWAGNWLEMERGNYWWFWLVRYSRRVFVGNITGCI